MPKINNLHPPLLHRKAFTLIELLISVSIMAIIGASAIPIFMGFGSRQYPKETAKNLISALNLTKSKAYSGANGRDWFMYMIMQTDANGNTVAKEYSMYDANSANYLSTQQTLGESLIAGITLTSASRNTVTVGSGDGLLILFKKIPDLDKGEIYHLTHTGNKLPICSTKPLAYTCSGSFVGSPLETCTASWGLDPYKRYCESDTLYECSCWNGVEDTGADKYVKAEITIVDKNRSTQQIVTIEQQQPSGNLVYRIEPTP